MLKKDLKQLVRLGSYFFLLAILFGACDTESNVDPRFEQYFIKYYGGEGNQRGHDFQPTPDGGFILLGSSTTQENGWEFFLVKVDELGNQQWSATYGGAGDDFGRSVTLLGENTYVIAGNMENSSGKTDILLVKTDLDGQEITRNTFGDVDFDEDVYAINVTNDEGIVIAGSSTNTAAFPKGVVSPDDTHDFFFPRVDASLQPLPNTDWISRNGFQGNDMLAVGLEKSDGKFLFFGTSDVKPPLNSQKDGNNMILFQTTSDGISDVGDELFGTLSNEKCTAVANTSDNGFAMVGATQNGEGINDIYFARVRSDNSLIRQGAIGSSRNVRGKSISEVKGGGFVITADQFQNESSNIYLTKVTNDGAILWERTFGGNEDDTVGKVVQLEDESFVFIGTVTLENQTKMCLIKTNPDGELNP